MSLKKKKSQGKAVEMTVHSKEENVLRLLSGFRPRIPPQDTVCNRVNWVNMLIHMYNRYVQCTPLAKEVPAFILSPYVMLWGYENTRLE